MAQTADKKKKLMLCDCGIAHFGRYPECAACHVEYEAQRLHMAVVEAQIRRELDRPEDIL